MNTQSPHHEYTSEEARILQEANCLSRFDRLPFRGRVVGIIGLLAFISIIEAFDVGLIGQTVLVLKSLWGLSPAETGLLGTSSTCGVVLGTFCCGCLSDRFGRKIVLMVAVVEFTLFTLITPLVENLTWVVALRFLAGLGSGAVFPIPYLYITELIGAKMRGVVFGYCNSILVFAYILPSGVGAWAVANFAPETAWKIPYIVGGMPIMAGYLIHRYMPESPRWLIRNGRMNEALRLVEQLESSVGMAPDPHYVDKSIVKALTESRGAAMDNWRLLFTPPYLIRTIVSWSMFAAALVFTYVVMVYTPTILQQKGFSGARSVLFSGVMMSIGVVSGIICGHLIDRYGRKVMYIFFAGLAALFSILLSIVEEPQLFLVLGIVFAFCGNGLFSICKLYIAEQYPTQLRGKGAGFGEAACRVFSGVISAYCLAFFLDHGSQNVIYWYMAAAYLTAIILLSVWGKETMGKSVDTTGSAAQ